MHSEIKVFGWAMKNMLRQSTCQNFVSDCEDLIAMIKEHKAWLNFSTEPKEIEALQRIFHSFKISYILQGQNAIAEYLSVKNARSFIKNIAMLVVLFFSGFLDHL